MKNQALVKILVLSLISAIPTFFLGKILANLSANPGAILAIFINIPTIIMLLLTLAASAAFLSLVPSFNPKNEEIILAAIAPTLSFAAPQILFLGENFFVIGITTFLFLVATVKLGSSLRSSIQSRIKIKVWELYPSKIKGLFLAISLIFSLSFGITYFLKIEREGFKIPDIILDQALDLVVPIFENQLGQQIEQQFGERFTERVGIEGQEEILKFLRKELGETLREGEGRQQFGLSPENLNLEKIKITPEGKLDLSEALSGMKQELKTQIEKMVAPYEKFIAPLLAVLLFFSLHFLGRIAVIFCPMVIALVLKIFSQTGFTKVEKEMVEAERLRL